MKYKSNGKEFDRMHGLDTYDYGARQYDPARITWDRMDQLCEKKPWNNPYIFCSANPINRIDPDGKDDFFDSSGNFLRSTKTRTNNIYIEKKTTTTLLSEYKFKYFRPMIRLLQHYAKQIGVKANIGIGIKNRKNTSNTYAETLNKKAIYFYTKYMKFDNDMNSVDNMKSTMNHEKIHIEDIKSTPSDEVETIMREMEAPYFKNTTDEFKDGTCGYLQKELTKLYERSTTSYYNIIEEAMRLLEKYGANSHPMYYDGTVRFK